MLESGVRTPFEVAVAQLDELVLEVIPLGNVTDVALINVTKKGRVVLKSFGSGAHGPDYERQAVEYAGLVAELLDVDVKMHPGVIKRLVQ